MKTIITLDRANQPYGFPQLNENGGLTANTIYSPSYMGGYAHFGTGNPTPYLGGLHNVEITASGSTAPLTLIGGTGGVEVWVDDTPTKAIWFGAATPGLASDGDIHLSTYSPGGGWDDRIVINNETGNVKILGLTADTSDTNLLSVDGNGVIHTYPLSGLTGTTSSGDYLPLSGGTVTGGTSFTSGLTANTLSATSINKVDYIVFNTGTTSVATVPGTVYFDNTEKALSYNTSINQGVTVNMGQQNYIRVYNNSGVQINRGSVLEILTAFSGLPAVTLAVNKQFGGSDIIGVAAENIPINTEGVAITYGIISGITLTGASVGSLVYASDTVSGGTKTDTEYFSFPLTARTNVVGYIVQTGVTDGKLFVTIQNENNNLNITSLQRNVLEGNVISTGVFGFSGITLASSSTFNVGAVEAWIVDNTTFPLNPSVTYVSYSGQTNIPSLYYTAGTETYLLLTSAGTLTQQTTYPTPRQRRQEIYLGKMGHGNRTSLINAFNEPDLDVSPISQLRDMFTPIKLINENVYPSAYTGLTFGTSSGTIWGLGINFVNDDLNPSSLTVSGNTITTFQYRTQTGGTASNITTIDPGNYDLNGIITAIGTPAKQATNQRIYLLQNGQFRIQYGQTKYADLATAIAAVSTESFTTFSNFKDNAILIAILSVRSDASLLTDPLQSKITFASKFGESVGGTGGVSTTNLQQAYNNSSNPEILTNSTEGALSIQNGAGTADNVTNLIEGKNTATSTTSFIRADGLISGNTVSTPSFTANANGMTATTVSATTYYGVNAATGGTYSNGTITLRGTGTLGTITGLGGSGGGQLYYLNLSVAQNGYQEFSPIPTTASQQTTGTSISSGVTSTLASFLTPSTYPNTNQLPGGIWSFYLHTYKDVVGSSFNTYVQVYKRTSGGTETLLFTTDPSPVDGVSPTPAMQITDAYYSGTSLNTSDRILVVVKGVNTGVSTQTITLVTEGSQYYSYATTPFGAGTPNYTTGGTYNESTGILTFTRTDGNSYTAGTFSYVTAVTESENVITVTSNGGSPSTYTIDAVTGGTYNGTTGVITLSGTGSVNGNQITGFSTGGGGLTWNNATTTESASVDNGYVGTATTLTTITLPSTAAFGTTVEVVGTGTGLWRISQNSGQSIKFGIATTATGTGGYLSATSQYDCVKLLCTSTDTTFVVTSAIGNIFFI